MNTALTFIGFELYFYKHEDQQALKNDSDSTSQIERIVIFTAKLNDKPVTSGPIMPIY